MLRLVLLNCKPVSLHREQNFGYFQIPLFLIPKTAIHHLLLFLSTADDFSSPASGRMPRIRQALCCFLALSVIVPPSSLFRIVFYATAGVSRTTRHSSGLFPLLTSLWAWRTASWVAWSSKSGC